MIGNKVILTAIDRTVFDKAFFRFIQFLLCKAFLQNAVNFFIQGNFSFSQILRSQNGLHGPARIIAKSRNINTAAGAVT